LQNPPKSCSYYAAALFKVIRNEWRRIAD